MSSFDSRRWLRSRYLWAIGIGLLWASAYPKIGLAGAAWAAPALLLWLGIGQGSKAIFRTGYVCGASFTFTVLSWLLAIPATGYPIVGWIALSAYLALYPALWVWLCWKWCPVADTADGRTPAFIADKSSLLQRTAWALSCAVLWVALEMVVARLLSGFPWLFLGNSQFRMTPLIQISSVTGVYGVSFLMAWLSISLACAGMVMIRNPGKVWMWMTDLAFPGFVLIGALGYGFQESLKARETGKTLKLALIQPSIPQTIKWDAEKSRQEFAGVIQLSEAALLLKPDVLIWPEAATPGLVRFDPEISSLVTNLVERHRVWLILGADDAEMPPGAVNDEDALYFNSAFLLNPNGRIETKYDKRNLVAFGEYIPLLKWLPFIKWFTPITGGFTPGTEVVPFDLKDVARVFPLICFEDVFPHLVRHYVDEDSDFVLNLTNNGWFGESAAHWQHVACSVFRAVENRVTVVRCTNNGLTCWIDDRGRIREYFGEDGNVYGKGFKIVEVPLLAEGQKRNLTFYTRHGDVFGWSCVGIAALLGVVHWKRPRVSARLSNG